MKLSQLAAKPQLIKVEVDDEDTIKEYGESLEFWTWDRQPLETFMKLAGSKEGDSNQMISIVKTLILDEDGKEIIKDELMLPASILIKVVSKIVDALGK